MDRNTSADVRATSSSPVPVFGTLLKQRDAEHFVNHLMPTSDKQTF
jgi:hypothetical protein